MIHDYLSLLYLLLIPTIDDSWFPCEKNSCILLHETSDTSPRGELARLAHSMAWKRHSTDSTGKSPASLEMSPKKTMGLEMFYPWLMDIFFMIQHKQNYLSQWVSWDRMRWYGMSPVVLDWYTTTSTTILHLASLFVKCAWKTRFRAPWLPIFDMEYGYYQIAHLLPRKHRRPDLGCTSINPRSAGIWP